MQDKKRTGLVRLFGVVALFLALFISYLAVWANSPTQSKAPASAVQPIEITRSAMQHIIDRHTPGGKMNAGKSIFNREKNIQSLIKHAEPITPVQQARGNCQRVVNAGRIIGIDRRTDRQTSTYTVITTQSGKLVTAFPGLP